MGRGKARASARVNEGAPSTRSTRPLRLIVATIDGLGLVQGSRVVSGVQGVHHVTPIAINNPGYAGESLLSDTLPRQITDNEYYKHQHLHPLLTPY